MRIGSQFRITSCSSQFLEYSRMLLAIRVIFHACHSLSSSLPDTRSSIQILEHDYCLRDMMLPLDKCHIYKTLLFSLHVHVSFSRPLFLMWKIASLCVHYLLSVIYCHQQNRYHIYLTAPRFDAIIWVWRCSFRYKVEYSQKKKRIEDSCWSYIILWS